MQKFQRYKSNKKNKAVYLCDKKKTAPDENPGQQSLLFTSNQIINLQGKYKFQPYDNGSEEEQQPLMVEP